LVHVIGELFRSQMTALWVRVEASLKKLTCRWVKRRVDLWPRVQHMSACVENPGFGNLAKGTAASEYSMQRHGQ
jgi:RNase P/RNase MRP subunit p30